ACPEHGVRVVKLPWAEPSARFTALLEALAIEWLKAASQKAVAGLLNRSWEQIQATTRWRGRAMTGCGIRRGWSPKTQGVQATARQRIEDGAGVGVEGNDDGVFRRSL
ncbi:MAG TPA: transposase family protein, partial [Bryobacterales bacterium]|nr:transposase family protein [Bryobacterales bacterium]